MQNAIYVRRRSKVLLPDGAGATPPNVLASLQKNLESLGFLLGEDVLDRLRAMSPVQVDAFYQRLVKDLKTLVGAHHTFEPFYPDFPHQVMDLSEAVLYFNATRASTRPGSRRPPRRSTCCGTVDRSSRSTAAWRGASRRRTRPRCWTCSTPGPASWHVGTTIWPEPPRTRRRWSIGSRGGRTRCPRRFCSRCCPTSAAGRSRASCGCSSRRGRSAIVGLLCYLL